MAREGLPNYMPASSRAGFRPSRPASSAPAFRRGGATSPGYSDDEGGEARDEGSSIMNRCSPKAVYLVVSKFSEYKKQIIRDIGFGGILDLPCITKVNLKLSVWLLSKLDTEESALVFGSKRIWFHERDIGIVFGIPDGEMDVGSVEISPAQIDLIRQSCGLDSRDARSIKGLELILEQHLDDTSTSQELNRFKIAFVIFVMTHLLAPSVKHDQCNLDFFGAIKNSDKIDRFNWCRYVYTYVLDGARKVQDELFRKGHVTCLTGCHLFLQILFLDNVDIRSLNKPHTIIPRIKVFDAESLRKMALMCSSRDQNDFSRFTGIRSPSTSAYMRHTFQSPLQYSGPGGSRAAVNMTIKPISAPTVGPHSSCQLNPHTFEFSQPSDLGAYIRAKYPGLVKTYAMDFIQMHNAQLMQEMAKLRVAIIRRNAELVDWLAQHVGSTQLQLIHRRPTSQMRPADPILPTESSLLHQFHTMQARSNEDVAESSSGNAGPPRGLSTAKRSTSLDDKQKLKKLRTGSNVPAATNTEILAHTPCNATFQTSMTSLEHKFRTASGVPAADDPKIIGHALSGSITSEPSFDLGIDESQNAAQFVTPKANVFPINPLTSPVPYQQSSSPHHNMMCLAKMVTPESSTKENAYNIVIDHVDVAEVEIDTNSKVSYLLPVDDNFVKVSVPVPPPHVATWKDCQRHPTPDTEALDLLYLWCKNSGSHDDNR